MCCMRQGSAVLCREIGDKASSSGHHLFGNSKQPAVSSAAVTVVTCLLLLSGTLGHTAALACIVAAICLLLCRRQGQNLAHADSCEVNSFAWVQSFLKKQTVDQVIRQLQRPTR